MSELQQNSADNAQELNAQLSTLDKTLKETNA